MFMKVSITKSFFQESVIAWVKTHRWFTIKTCFDQQFACNKLLVKQKVNVYFKVSITKSFFQDSVIALKATKKKKQATKVADEQTKKEKENSDVLKENNPRVNSLRKKAFKSKQKEKRKQGM